MFRSSSLREYHVSNLFKNTNNQRRAEGSYPEITTLFFCEILFKKADAAITALFEATIISSIHQFSLKS